MIVTDRTKRALARRREARELTAIGYRRHETDWEIHRGYKTDHIIVDALISVDGKYVWTKLGPKMTDKIRQQIKHLQKLADNQHLCGVDAGRSGQCHASWEMEEAADTLEKLLAVYEAAQGVRSSVDSADRTAMMFGLWEAVNAVQTSQQNSPLMAAGEDNQESGKSGTIGAPVVSGRGSTTDNQRVTMSDLYANLDRCEICELQVARCNCPSGPWNDVEDGITFLLNEHKRLTAENKQLIDTFRHTHVKRTAVRVGEGDICVKCGLDLRNSIHLPASTERDHDS